MSRRGLAFIDGRHSVVRRTSKNSSPGKESIAVRWASQAEARQNAVATCSPRSLPSSCYQWAITHNCSSGFTMALGKMQHPPSAFLAQEVSYWSYWCHWSDGRRFDATEEHCGNGLRLHVEKLRHGFTVLCHKNPENRLRIWRLNIWRHKGWNFKYIQNQIAS